MKNIVRALCSLVAVVCAACGGQGSSQESAPIQYDLSGAFTGLAAFALLSEQFQGAACGNFLKIMAVPSRPATAILYGSFGNNPGCLDRLYDQTVAAGKPLAVEVHFSREVGRERGALGSRDFYGILSDKGISDLIERMSTATEASVAGRVMDILTLTRPGEPNIKYLLSSGLEHRYSQAARVKMLETLRKYWPYELVDNPQPMLFDSPEGIYNEQHSYTARARRSKCIVNADGQDVDFLSRPGISAWQANATRDEVTRYFQYNVGRGCISLFWYAEGQGIDGLQNSPLLERRFNIRDEDVLTISEVLLQAEGFYSKE